MTHRSTTLIFLAGLLTMAATAGCGEKPPALSVAPVVPAAALAQKTLPASMNDLATSTPPVATPSADPAQTATGTASATETPSDPPLTSSQIASVVPGWTTFSGDPAQPNDPADRLIPGDPINVVVVGTQDQLDAAMLRSGWVHPAPITAGSVLKMGWALVRGSADPTAPVSNLYLFGRQQDLAWETNASDVHHRDHCRAWRAPLRDGDGQDVWLISGTKDIGIEWDSRRHTTTHKISPDIDAERDLIAQVITGVSDLKRSYKIAGIGGGRPYVGKNGGGDPYDTDGMATVVEF
ncbi:MAG TPA: LssY C-terminal domain-containing protein [Oscillatoriaceae cyanobacterium]